MHPARGPSRRGAGVALWALGVCVAVWPGRAPAQALQSRLQTLPTFSSGANTLQVQIARPTLNLDGVQLSCSFGQANCAVFNRQMCDSDLQSTPLQISVTRGSANPQQISSSQLYAYAWLQRGNTVCSNDPTYTEQGNLVWPYPVARSRPLTSTYSVSGGGGSTAVNIPTDFSDSWPSDARAADGTALFTLGDIVHVFDDVCDPNGGVPYARWRVCVGVDFSNTGTINGQAQAGTGSGNPQTPAGYMEFLIGTQAPPAPQVGDPVPLHERVRLPVTIDNSQLTLVGVRIDAALHGDNGPTPCDETAAFTTGATTDIRQTTGVAEVDVEVPGINGVTYDYCVYSLDLLGNQSQPTGPLTATPRPAFGVFSLWADAPPRLGFGSCGQGLVPSTLLPLAWALWRARPGRRRARRAPPEVAPPP